MAAGRRGKRGMKQQAARQERVPRSVGTVARIKRIYDAGNIVRGAVDTGYQFGTVPGNLLDWASLQATWARYRLLSVRIHLILNGEFDTTPAYPTFFVYHDLVSSGAPLTIADALLKEGVKQLSFGANAPIRTFTFVPNVWTSAGFATQLPAPQARYQTATAAAPAFSSVACWGLNYNSTVGTPAIRIVQEMLLEFSEPI